MAEVVKVRKRTTRTKNQITTQKSSRTRSQLKSHTDTSATNYTSGNLLTGQKEESGEKETNKTLLTADSGDIQDVTFRSSLIFDYVIVPTILVIVIALCYFNALSCGLVFDDSSAIINNKDIRSTSPIWQIFENDFWGTPIRQEYSHKSYRPVTVLTFRLNHSLTGLDPFYLHLTNIIIYGVVCFLVYILSRKFMSSHASSVTTLIFTTHPIHTEAVTGIVGRAELLMSLFSLSAFLTYRYASLQSKTTVLSFISFSLSQVFICASFFSKEQGLAIVPVIATYEIFIARGVTIYQIFSSVNIFRWLSRGSLLRITIILLTGFINFGFRLLIMGGQPPVFTRFDNPASYEEFPKKHLTFNYLLPLNLWLLIFPNNLLCDYSMGTIPLVESFQDIRNIATVIFYTILAVSIYISFTCDHSQTRYVLILGISITIFTYLPASNLFVYVGFTIAERVLFMPSVGLCLIFGYTYSRYICRQSTRIHSHSLDLKEESQEGSSKKSLSVPYRNIILYIILGTAIMMSGYRTHLRNYDWVDDLSLFKSGLQVTNQNAKLYNNIGHVYERQGQLKTALGYYQQAADRQPDDIGSFINVGRAYYSLKEYDKARQQFLIAKELLPKPKKGQTYYTRVAPNHLDVYLHLANIEALDPKNYDTVISLLSQVIRMRPDYTKARLKLAQFYLANKKTNEARDVYETALKYSPDDPDIYYNLGVVSYHQNKFEEALSFYEKALTIDPSHRWSLYASSVVNRQLTKEQKRWEQEESEGGLQNLSPTQPKSVQSLA